MVPSSALHSVIGVNARGVGQWWVQHPRAAVGLIAIAATGVHALFLGAPLAPDEGGYLLVANHWHDGGPLIYGHYWVDRPPLLLIAFAIAGLAGPVGIHLLACLCSGVAVLAAGWAGWAVAGRKAGMWSALTAGALSASTLADAQELDGELLAIPFVLLSCALLLHAWYRRPKRWYVFGWLAGVMAIAAPLIKQNFVEALVFAMVFIGAQLLGSTGRRRAKHLATAFSFGAMTGLAAVTGWAITTNKLGALWFATYTFRAQAGAVIHAGSWHAPGARLVQLLGLSVVSGIFGLCVLAVIAHRFALRRGDPLTWALVAGLGVELGGIALGGSFWPHYLIGIVPMLSIAVGTAATLPQPRSTIALRGIVLLAVVVSAVSAPAAAANTQLFSNRADRVGTWLGHAAQRDDTAIVTFTHPNILQQSNLSSPYPYVWSLPVRTLDPDLALMKRTILGSEAPTWIIEWDGFNTWLLDPHERFATAVAGRYRIVAHICGHPIWLRDGVRRPVRVSRGC